MSGPSLDIWSLDRSVKRELPRGGGEACQIFVLGEEARSMPSFSFMSLFPSLPASWTSLPPPSTINCIKILGGGMESSSIRTGCWWIQLCRQSQQLSFQECNSHAMLRSQHPPPPEPSPSLSIPSTMFSEPWRAWYKHLIYGWASDCHLFSILCPVRGPGSNCNHYQKKVLWTKLTVVSLEGNLMGKLCLFRKTATAPPLGPISE